MLTECPHCLTVVVPKRDGTCPSCQRDTRDLRGADRDRTTVVIGEHSQLPSICCVCGIPANRVVRVQGSKPLDGEVPAGYTPARAASIWLFTSFLFGPLIGTLARLLSGLPRSWNFVRVSIIQCDECGTSGPPKPLRVDHEHFTMRFVVHRNFRRRFGELNASQDTTD
jgi:hypothetical protein